MSEQPTPRREHPSTGQAPSAGGARTAGGARWRIPGSTVFFAVVTLVLAGYTVMAFGMDWVTHAGRLGPGFFPRWIGLIGCALAALVALRARTPHDAPTDDETADRTRHPGMIVLLGVGLAGFVLLMVPAGAVATGIAFLLAAYLVIDRTRVVRAVVIAVCFPPAVFVVLQHWFNAGLPVSPLGFL